MAGRKMAKSAGNFQRVTELIDEGIDPLAFRYLVLTSRYGHKLNYSDASIAAAAAGLASLRNGLTKLGPPPSTGPWVAPQVLTAGAAPDRPQGEAAGASGFGGGRYALADRAHAPTAPLSEPGRALHDRFVEALDDDLDLPAALVCVREILRADLPADERRWLVLDADAVLGLDLHRVWEEATDAGDIPADIAALLRDRDEARAARDYARADALRDRDRRRRFRRHRRARGVDRASPLAGSAGGARPLGSADLLLAHQQVAARPEPVDDPVEVPLGLPGPLLLREAFPAAVLVADRRDVGDADRAPRPVPLPGIAQHEAPPDVEVPIEPEPFVERPALSGVVPTEREQVALDGVDVAWRRILERPQVGRRDAPSTGDGYGGVIQGADERRDHVAGRFDARVHEHDHGRGCAPEPDIGGRALAQPFARPDDVDPAVGQSVELQTSPRPTVRPPTTTIDVPSGEVARSDPTARSRSVGQSVAISTTVASPTGGSSKRDGTFREAP